MTYVPLRITAQMGQQLSAYDDWSPAMDSLLERLWFVQQGYAEPDPHPDELLHAPIPLQMAIAHPGGIVTPITTPSSEPMLHRELPADWLWCSSSPCYFVNFEGLYSVRKRHDPHVTNHIADRSFRWSSSEGQLKDYDLQLPFRDIRNCIVWFAVGDRTAVEALLKTCTHIGKKSSIGYGLVTNWAVEEVTFDYSTWGPDGELMRPLPTRLMPQRPINFAIRRWGWRPCGRIAQYQEVCAMPALNVRRWEA